MEGWVRAASVPGRGNEVVYNVDKRTQRRDDAAHYAPALAAVRERVALAVGRQEGVAAGAAVDARVRICFRKRPLFEHESQQGEFDVVCAGSGVVAVSTCTHKVVPRRGQVRTLETSSFPCDVALAEDVSEGEVYEQVGRPLVERARRGGTATCFVFGQTGSGKTFTMASIHRGVAREAFGGGGAGVELVCFELLGKVARDLGEPGLPEVRLMEAADGSVVPHGARVVRVAGEAELMDAVEAAVGRRETASTAANFTSSRSHAVVQLRFAPGDGGGTLTLVDLAGSERNLDSRAHDQARRKETIEINASLAALKECLRKRALSLQGVATHVPYRNSALTKVLKAALSDPDAWTTVVATVSPGVTNTEHTLSTMQAVSFLLGDEGRVRTESAEVMPRPSSSSAALLSGDLTPPQRWSNAQLRCWLQGIDQGRYGRVAQALPASVTGAQFLRLTPQRLSQLLGENVSPSDRGGAFPDVLGGGAGADLYARFRARIKRSEAAGRHLRLAMKDKNQASVSVYATAQHAPQLPQTRPRGRP